MARCYLEMKSRELPLFLMFHLFHEGTLKDSNVFIRKGKASNTLNEINVSATYENYKLIFGKIYRKTETRDDSSALWKNCHIALFQRIDPDDIYLSFKDEQAKEEAQAAIAKLTDTVKNVKPGSIVPFSVALTTMRVNRSIAYCTSTDRSLCLMNLVDQDSTPLIALRDRSNPEKKLRYTVEVDRKLLDCKMVVGPTYPLDWGEAMQMLEEGKLVTYYVPELNTHVVIYPTDGDGKFLVQAYNLEKLEECRQAFRTVRHLESMQHFRFRTIESEEELERIIPSAIRLFMTND